MFGKQSRFVRRLMQTLVVYYLGLAAAFFFVPHAVFEVLNIGPTVFGWFEPLPMPSDRYLPTLASLLLFTLALLSIATIRSDHKASLLGYQLTIQSVSCAAFGYLFAQHSKAFGFLITFVLDGLIALCLTVGLTLLSVRPATTRIAPPPVHPNMMRSL